MLTGLNVTGDLLDSTIDVQAGTGMVLGVSTTGDADIDLTAGGMIVRVTAGDDLSGSIASRAERGYIISATAGGNLSASLQAPGGIFTAKATGDITSPLIRVEGTGGGMLSTLSAGGNINVTDLDIDGMIMNIKTGTSSEGTGNLSGNIKAGSNIIGIDVDGDIYADVTAGGSIFNINASGSLMGQADISSTGANINRVTINGTIYGNIAAQAGAGTVSLIRYGQSADPATELVDSLLMHVNAEIGSYSKI